MLPYKLGKRPARHDPRTVRLAHYLTLPAPPASADWTRGIAHWGMMGNDAIGDCTSAAIGHAVQLTSANTASEVTIPDRAIIAAYSAVSGYDPRTGANDNGAYILDVLKYWQQTGVAGHKALAYAACDIRTLDDVRAAIALLGFCDIGFNVPQSAMTQFDRGQPWEVVPNDGGIIGGHCVDLVGYDADRFFCLTWDRVQPMSVAFFQQYCDEGYGVVLPEWLAANGQSPSGLNLQQLLSDVQQLQQAPDPVPPADPWAPFDAWWPQADAYFAASHDRKWLKTMCDTGEAWTAYYGTGATPHHRRKHPPVLPPVPAA